MLNPIFGFQSQENKYVEEFSDKKYYHSKTIYSKS